MARHKYMNIKSICFLNSREIFDGLLSGKTLGSITENILKRTDLTNARYFQAGLREWIQELGFNDHIELKEHIFEFGLPPGKEHITKALLENQRQKIEVRDQIGPAKVEKKPSESVPRETKKAAKLFSKEVNIGENDGKGNESGLMPRKEKTVKSVNARLKENLDK